jgi:phytanoyl-CoA hydroxylase
MHAEYGIFVYTIWPLFARGAAPHARRLCSRYIDRQLPASAVNASVTARSLMSSAPTDLAQYVEEYWTKGWTVVPVFTQDEAASLAATLLDITSQEQDAAIERNGGLRNDYMTDVGPDGTAAPRKTGNPFHKRPIFRELATDGRLRAVAAAMLRTSAEQTKIFSDQAFCKGPKVGGAKPVHQDNFYFGIDSSDDVITCWTALDDTDLGNGCMRLVTGAYKNGIVPHHKTFKDSESTHFDWDADQDTFDASLEVPVVVPSGSTLCWHGAALHGSRANTSDRWRRAWAVHFVSGTATKDGDSTPIAQSCSVYEDEAARL